MTADRFTDEELAAMLTEILLAINPDRDPDEMRRKVDAAIARRNVEIFDGPGEAP